MEHRTLAVVVGSDPPTTIYAAIFFPDAEAHRYNLTQPTKWRIGIRVRKENITSRKLSCIYSD